MEFIQTSTTQEGYNKRNLSIIILNPWNEMIRALDLASITGVMEIDLFWIDNVEQIAGLDPVAMEARKTGPQPHYLRGPEIGHSGNGNNRGSR